MNENFDVNGMIKAIRFMGFTGIFISIMFSVGAFYLFQGDMSSIPSGGVFIIASIPLGLYGGILGGISNVFRSQQLEIDQLKTTVQQLQCANEHVKVE